jgi:hypothetical protein
VLVGVGAGRFDARFTPFGNSVFFVRLADLNGDGRLDLAIADSVAGPSFTLSLIPGEGDGTFDTAAAIPAVAGQAIGNILVTDYSGDGKQDLVVSVPCLCHVRQRGTPIRTISE